MADKFKYVVLPYEGSFEKVVDVKVTIPQKEMKYEYMRRFLYYVYLLEEVALHVREGNHEKANKKLDELKSSEFMVFKPSIKKDD